MRYRYILGIETTCDDTGIGIFDIQKNRVIANEVISSSKLQGEFGGVVPEIAARKHEENLNLVLNKALKKANLFLGQIDMIAYSSEPGLPSCLFSGKIFAEFLHLFLSKPLVPVNHLYAHLFSGEIEEELGEFPAIGMVVSGGHTAFYLVRDYHVINLLDQTHDDAVGEVYDKVGRSLGLCYPAGPKIDRLFSSKAINEKLFKFSCKQSNYLSFSGLKTAVLTHIKSIAYMTEPTIISIASTFQKKIVDILLVFLRKYLQIYPETKSVFVGGGVSANSYLQSELIKSKLRVLLPKQRYTGDNGAMIAYYASKIYKKRLISCFSQL